MKNTMLAMRKFRSALGIKKEANSVKVGVVRSRPKELEKEELKEAPPPAEMKRSKIDESKKVSDKLNVELIYVQEDHDMEQTLG